jgi:nucleotide-binding universal stress UspA family protein
MVSTSGAMIQELIENRQPRNRVAVRAATPARQAGPGFSSILACIDNSRHAIAVLAWAAALARSLDASLRILHVLDTSKDYATPQDPIAWELRQREERSRLEALIAQVDIRGAGPAEIDVAVGQFEERFLSSLAASKADLCVIGAVGDVTRPDRVIGDTARRITETANCSVLIVPPQMPNESAQGGLALRRLMVPLDCSRRAETALPAAIAIADSFGADMVMAHAVPEPSITALGPPDETDMALQREVVEHNRKAAVRYLSRIRARLALDRRPVRTLILSGVDPRHHLLRAVADEEVDLIVLAAKGAGGYTDQPLGSVTSFLVTHLGKPLLIVRPGCDHTTATTSAHVRAPGQQHPPRNQV